MRALLLGLFLGLSLCGAQDSGTLTQPLIVDPNAPTEAQQANLASIAQVFADEPAAASVDQTQSPSAEDAILGLLVGGQTGGAAAAGGGGAAAGGGGGSTDTSSSDTASTDNSGGGGSGSSSTDTSAITTEIKLLSNLIQHGKAIAAALPAKEQRLNALAAQLNAANGAQAAQGAQQKLQEQQLLLQEIQLKIAALKQKLEDLQTTETKLQTSINNVQAAVNTNTQVQHQLNQEAAVAEAGGAAASGGASGSAAVQAAPSLFEAADKVTREVEQKLGILKRHGHRRS